MRVSGKPSWRNPDAIQTQSLGDGIGAPCVSCYSGWGLRGGHGPFLRGSRLEHGEIDMRDLGDHMEGAGAFQLGSKCYAGIACTIENMEKAIQSYDKIILIPDGMKHFPGSIHSVDRKVLLILTEPYEAAGKNIAVWVVSKAEAEGLLRFYHTYEFTDNFLVWAEHEASFAPVSNFVRAGFLSAGEAWEAMLL